MFDDKPGVNMRNLQNRNVGVKFTGKQTLKIEGYFNCLAKSKQNNANGISYI